METRLVKRRAREWRAPGGAETCINYNLIPEILSSLKIMLQVLRPMIQNPKIIWFKKTNHLDQKIFRVHKSSGWSTSRLLSLIKISHVLFDNALCSV